MAAVRELPWLARHSSPGRVVPFPRLAPFNFPHTRGRFWQPRRFTPRSLCSEGRRSTRSGSRSRRTSDPRSPGRARAERAAIGPSPGIAFRCRGSMDANLRLWRAEGPSFWQRLLLWADVLDPLHLLKSADEIRRARLLLENNEKTQSEPLQNHQTKQAFLLSLASVHPDTGRTIPVFFRPPAFLPVTLPLVMSSSLQLQAKQIFLCQFAFHAYTTGFTLLNGNCTTKDEENSLHQKQILLGVGAVSYAALLGAFPFYFMDRYTLKSPVTNLVVKRLLPAPLLGLMNAFTVVAVRSAEFENGIEVMDRNGKVVGVSKKAGEKAVKETALSRGILFGTTFFLPAALMHFVERANTTRTPRALASLRMLLTMAVLAGMLPISLGIFPQCGEIKREELEAEILSSTEETVLFYNRGI
ncbi:sideroflexin-4 [Tympanuchus pallidicinctus]|uniref:sideroflexin-4 n=1 Tax=Tympanuchus pallidicinctus TaxID=109042 RepID=UPI0022873264|nr:sideroflexin-4 [Tympanuchus pallidicinctus]